MPPSKIDLSAPTFQHDLRDALKRHSTFRKDLETALQELEKNPSLGDWIPGLGEEVRKIRVGVKAQQIGKSNGYRLIYRVDRATDTLTPILLHYKPDVELVPVNEIAAVLKNLRKGQSAPPETSGPVN